MSRISILVFVVGIVAPFAVAQAEGALATGWDNSGRSWSGIETDAATEADARGTAMQNCLKFGPHCSIATTFRKTCIATAHGKEGCVFFSVHDDIEVAHRAALQRCQQSCSSCKIFRRCDTIDEREHIEFNKNWAACNNRDVEACERVLGYHGLGVNDHSKVTKWREWLIEEEKQLAAIETEKRALEAREQQKRLEETRDAELRAAEARRLEREALERYERQVRTAFNDDRTACQGHNIAACDRALVSPAASKEDRDDLARWRLQALAAIAAQAKASNATLPDSVPDQGHRIALVIGNSNYRYAPKLANPKRDAQDVATALRRAGFPEVTERYDVTLQDFVAELRKFESRTALADWAVIYFAGHGMEIDGANFLIPIDANLERANDAEDEALALDRVFLRINSARRLKLVILDACRNNPFVARMLGTGTPTRAIGRGLAPVEPQPGVLVAFAARHGQIALDGTEGANSPYATALIAHLDEPGLEINRLFRKVRDAVLTSTRGAQQLFEYGSLPGTDFYFRVGVR